MVGPAQQEVQPEALTILPFRFAGAEGVGQVFKCGRSEIAGKADFSASLLKTFKKNKNLVEWLPLQVLE